MGQRDDLLLLKHTLVSGGGVTAGVQRLAALGLPPPPPGPRPPRQASRFAPHPREGAGAMLGTNCVNENGKRTSFPSGSTKGEAFGDAISRYRRE